MTSENIHERRPARWFAAAVGAMLTLMAGAAMAAETKVAGDPEAAADGPVQMVRETSDAMLELIEEGRGYADEDPERFYRKVEQLLSPVVDFESFARGVMGVHYRDASPEQREEFVERFRSGLVRTYALALTEFEDGEVVVIPPDRPPRNPQRRQVSMEIRTDVGEVYPVLYSVVQDKSGEWQIRNLTVNGVNMGLTYRNQFNSAMNDPKYDGDIGKVIDDWGDMLKEEAPGLEGGIEEAEKKQQAGEAEA